MPDNKYLLLIAGPTASGKTSLSIRLADSLRTEILSADSRQFYREMDIGVAKPTADQRRAIPHHFINSLSINEDYSVGRFEKDALNRLEELFVRHDSVIACGGSGLYLRALWEGLDVFPEVPRTVRDALESRYRADGLKPLQEELLAVDPVYFKTADMHNPHRLIRALAVFRVSGLPYSEFLRQQKNPRDFTPVYICLSLPRDQLYTRIDQRVADMMGAGLLEEVRALFPFRHLTALKTVGYTELFDHLEGKTSLDEAVALIQQHTRNYAKRQMTWFRKYGDWRYFHPEDYEGVAGYVGGLDSRGPSDSTIS